MKLRILLLSCIIIFVSIFPIGAKLLPANDTIDKIPSFPSDVAKVTKNIIQGAKRGLIVIHLAPSFQNSPSQGKEPATNATRQRQDDTVMKNLVIIFQGIGKVNHYLTVDHLSWSKSRTDEVKLKVSKLRKLEKKAEELSDVEKQELTELRLWFEQERSLDYTILLLSKGLIQRVDRPEFLEDPYYRYQYETPDGSPDPNKVAFFYVEAMLIKAYAGIEGAVLTVICDKPGDYITKNVEAWNKRNSDDPISLIEITPAGLRQMEQVNKQK